MEIFQDITYEVTLNVNELKRHPDISTKAQYLATDPDIELYKNGSDFRIRAPRRSFKEFQNILLHMPSADSPSSILVRSFENEQNVLDLLTGDTWGKATGEDIVSVEPTVSLTSFALYMSQNYQFVTDKLHTHQSSINVKAIKANLVTFSLSGPKSQNHTVEKYLRDQYMTVRQTFEAFNFNIRNVSNKEQFIDSVFDRLKPILAIMVGKILYIIFPLGEIEDYSHLNDVVEICEAENCSLDENRLDPNERPEETLRDLESVLEEIWILKGMKTQTERNVACESSKEDMSPAIDQDSSHESDVLYKSPAEMTARSLVKQHDGFDLTERPHKSTFQDLEKDQGIGGFEKEKVEKFTEKDNKAVFIHMASKVRVVCCILDITKLDVDCIVNAASRDLGNHAGVAKAIAIAAGSSLHMECKKSIEELGIMQVAEVRTTTAGKLPCKKVLHTLGPTWGRDNHICVEQLQYAVSNCLSSAEEMQMKSIAIPAISAGKFGVPMFHVAQATSSAINIFCALHSETGQGYLKEIYLVDPGFNAVSAFGSAFDLYVKDGAFTKAEHK